MSRRYNYIYYTPSKPIKVEGGIKAKSKRGEIGDTWWSQRWVKTLESFGWSNRLQRGKRYARSGQVIGIDMKKGGIEARVQGSVSTPYKVSIRIKPFQQAQWKKIIDRMSQKAVFAAKLLAGEMPGNIEELFDDVKISLFPETRKDLTTKCSCPDSANPCKHIAAVHYILAEEFDRDPFMIFALRGKNKRELSEALRKMRTDSMKKTVPDKEEREEEQVEGKQKGTDDSEPQSPLSIDFWTGIKQDSFSLSIKAPETHLAIIKGLGMPSFWDSEDDFLNIMGDLYAQISQNALDILTGDLEEKEEKEEGASQQQELRLRFEEETGKNAFWRGRVTKNFLKWKEELNGALEKHIG